MQADLSVWGMYHHADIVVKVVMIGLILASVVTWAIFFGKGAEILASKRRLKREQQLVAEARSLDQASDIANGFEAKSLTSQLINEAQNELELSPQVLKITKALKNVPVSDWSVAWRRWVVTWGAATVIWRPSARFPRSSVCLVPSGAS
jgi:biopolymer transport protein ExbB/TolQ